MIFSSFEIVPNVLKVYLTDYRYTKMQSNIYKDIEAFEREGLYLKGFLDTNVIHLA